MRPERGGQDLYRILQVDPTAHPQVLRAAYRTLLKTLQKHPDVGGGEVEARRIIEAYATLRDPDRRREYDRWLSAHSRSPAARAAPPLELVAWIGRVLGEYREASGILFADRFDRVLEARRPGGARVFLKTFALLNRARWPYVLALRRAAQLARTGFRPVDDVVLLLTPHADELDAFLQTAGPREPWLTWHRCLLAVCTFPPPRIHTGRILFPPHALRRLAGAGRERSG